MQTHTYNGKLLNEAVALAIDGYACVNVTEDDAELYLEDNEEHMDFEGDEDRKEWIKSMVGPTVTSCGVPTAHVNLGFRDIVNNAKGIIDGVPTLECHDYAGEPEVAYVIEFGGHSFDNAVDELRKEDREGFLKKFVRSEEAIRLYVEDGGDIAAPPGSRQPAYGNLSGAPY